MNWRKRMKKYIIMGILGTMLFGVLTGCQKDYEGKGTPFSLSTSELSVCANEEIQKLSADNYERFLHASYILAIDKYGVMQKIKINENIKRHEWDFSNLESNGSFKDYVKKDGTVTKRGVDVSEHQGNIDWERASKEIDFAIVRLGYRGYGSGNIVKDAFYNRNMDGALENDLPVGVYFYSQATTYEEGVEEANYVLNHLGDYNIEYPIILDREDPMQDDARTNNLTVDQHTQAALGFLETIKNAGHKTMIYTNRLYFALYLDLEKIYQYPIWFAQYADEPDWPHEFAIWQYTDSGEIPGISGNVDLNLQMMDE